MTSTFFTKVPMMFTLRSENGRYKATISPWQNIDGPEFCGQGQSEEVAWGMAVEQLRKWMWTENGRDGNPDLG